MINTLGVLFIAYVGFGAYVYSIQERFFYYPVDTVNKTLDEEVFEHQGETIRATVLNRGQSKALLYFGGNAEDVDMNVNPFSDLFPGYTVYLVKYRGYGGSSGQPSEQAFYADALFIADSLSEQHSSISVIGRSIGSAVASYLAANRPINKLILVTPFDSAVSVAQSMWPIYPTGLLIKEKYDSLARVEQITAPTMLIVAEQDEVVDMALGKRLAGAFGSRAELYVVAEAGHNELSTYPEYHELLQNFLGVPVSQSASGNSMLDDKFHSSDTLQ